MGKAKDANEAKAAGKAGKLLPFKPEEPERAPDGAADPAPLLDDRWKWLHEHEWLRRPAPRKYLLVAKQKPWQARTGGVLGVGEVGVIAGAGAAGKSRAVTQLAVAVATGTEWLGTFAVERPGRVLLAMAEETQADMLRMLHFASLQEERGKLRLIERHAKLVGANVLPLSLRGLASNLADHDGLQAAATPLGQELERRLDDGGEWSLIIIDPAVSFAPFEAEKDNAVAQAWNNYLAALAAKAPGNPTIVQVHHTNKASRRLLTGLESVDTRGVSAVTDGPRWGAVMWQPYSHGKPPKTGKAQRFPAPDFACFRVTKVNHGVYPETLYLRRDPAREGGLRVLEPEEIKRHRLVAEEEQEDDKPQATKPASKLDGKRGDAAAAMEKP